MPRDVRNGNFTDGTGSAGRDSESLAWKLLVSDHEAIDVLESDHTDELINSLSGNDTADGDIRRPRRRRRGALIAKTKPVGGRSGSVVDAAQGSVSTGFRFYEVMPDKNGEVWAGELHGAGFLRLNPRTDQWIEYGMPELYAHDRRTWIDNSTDPISVG